MPELWVCQITEKYAVEISGKVGGSRGKTAGWCYVEIKGNKEDLEKAIEDIKVHPSVGKVMVKSKEEQKATLLVDIARCEACRVLMLSRYLIVYPVSIQGGYMTWNIITDSNLSLGSICSRLEGIGCTVQVSRVTSFEEKNLLTERQTELITMAFERGYFDRPKKINSHDLAKLAGVSPAAVSEIIRAAQRRILRDYVPAGPAIAG